MKLVEKNPNGFGIIIVVIAIAALAIILGGGYLYVSQQQQKQPGVAGRPCSPLEDRQCTADIRIMCSPDGKERKDVSGNCSCGEDARSLGAQGWQDCREQSDQVGTPSSEQKPDLIIKLILISIDRNLEELAPGQLRPNEVFINREVIVKNIGKVAVSKISVSFTDPTTGRVSKKATMNKPLNPGQEISMGPDYDFFDCRIGRKKIKAAVDYENEIAELAENNNSFETEFVSNCIQIE